MDFFLYCTDADMQSMIYNNIEFVNISSMVEVHHNWKIIIIDIRAGFVFTRICFKKKHTYILLFIGNDFLFIYTEQLCPKLPKKHFAGWVANLNLRASFNIRSVAIFFNGNKNSARA